MCRSCRRAGGAASWTGLASRSPRKRLLVLRDSRRLPHQLPSNDSHSDQPGAIGAVDPTYLLEIDTVLGRRRSSWWWLRTGMRSANLKLTVERYNFRARPRGMLRDQETSSQGEYHGTCKARRRILTILDCAIQEGAYRNTFTKSSLFCKRRLQGIH